MLVEYSQIWLCRVQNNFFDPNDLFRYINITRTKKINLIQSLFVPCLLFSRANAEEKIFHRISQNLNLFATVKKIMLCFDSKHFWVSTKENISFVILTILVLKVFFCKVNRFLKVLFFLDRRPFMLLTDTAELQRVK
jgi:hypothetical protein